MDKPLIVQTIQLALTPVFMLVAIGNIMNILSTRLARIVDRSRVLRQKHPETEGPEHDALVRELRFIARRIHLIGRAILSAGGVPERMQPAIRFDGDVFVELGQLLALGARGRGIDRENVAVRGVAQDVDRMQPRVQPIGELAGDPQHARRDAGIVHGDEDPPGRRRP